MDKNWHVTGLSCFKNMSLNGVHRCPNIGHRFQHNENQIASGVANWQGEFVMPEVLIFCTKDILPNC